MQLRKTSAFALYIGSYLPLSLVLLVQDIDLEVVTAGPCPVSDWRPMVCHSPLLHPIWSLGTVMIGVACLVITLLTLRGMPYPRRIRIAEAKHIPADLINYAMPYIVSFMGLDFASPIKLLGFGVFLFWIFWITYKSGQIVMNPILIVFGWRLYEIKYSFLQGEQELIGRALSRNDLEPGWLCRQGVLQDVMVVREAE